jgi:acyl carrier protein
MVPTHFVPMDAIPLTPIGKADRRALPPPAATRPQLDEEYVAPRDVLETLLAEHWRELLNLDRVGVNDRLFELGATSLKTMHFMTRLSRVLGRQIPIVTVFQTGTVAEIAAKLRSEYGEVVAPLVGGMDRRRPLGARSRRDVSAARGVTPRGARDRAAVLEQRRARLRGVVGEGPAEESDD